MIKTKIVKILPFVLSMFVSCFCFGQQKWEEYIQQLSEESQDEAQVENLYEDLTYLSQHPVNLNALTPEKLQGLPFLSETQLEKLNQYLARYGPLKSIYELRLVPDLDAETIELLLPFVYVGEPEKRIRNISLGEVLKYGKNEGFVRFDKCLNKKAGYADISEEELTKNPNKRYVGEPFYALFRYNFRYRDKISFGITAEKDAGEPFWTDRHKGFDYYSIHFLLKDFGRLKTFVLGDYRVNFGQGLILNTDFSMGKSSQVINIEKRNSTIKRHFSVNETDYFRGAAASMRFGKATASLFYSRKKIDATVDTCTQSILSIKKDGLHRTQSEMEKKGAGMLQVFGTSLNVSFGHFTGGVNFLRYNFDKTVNPDEKPYNRFYFRGKNNMDASIDYRYKIPGFTIFGETAICRNDAPATINGIIFELASYCRFSVLYRYYDKQYHAFFARAFSEGSGTQNESGVYMGWDFIPVAKWKLAAYADFFRFPWLRYGVDTPSEGFDGLVQLDYTLNRKAGMFLRYRYKNKEENVSSRYLDNTFHTHPIEDVFTHRWRYRFTYSAIFSLNGKTTVDYNLYHPAGAETGSKGFLVSQEVEWAPKRIPVSVDLMVARFRTDDYDSRVYAYEKNVLYAFYVPFFYGNGFRMVFNLRYAPEKNIVVYFRFAQTRYFDRDIIGSGLEAIDGNTKNDISCLLKWRF
jgi:hypothetical protein